MPRNGLMSQHDKYNANCCKFSSNRNLTVKCEHFVLIFFQAENHNRFSLAKTLLIIWLCRKHKCCELYSFQHHFVHQANAFTSYLSFSEYLWIIFIPNTLNAITKASSEIKLIIPKGLLHANMACARWASAVIWKWCEMDAVKRKWNTSDANECQRILRVEDNQAMQIVILFHCVCINLRYSLLWNLWLEVVMLCIWFDDFL